MKKLWYWVLAAGLSLGLMGCGGEELSHELVPESADVVVHVNCDADDIEGIIKAWNGALEDAGVPFQLPTGIFGMMMSEMANDDAAPLVKLLLGLDEDGKPAVSEMLLSMDIPTGLSAYETEKKTQAYAFIAYSDFDFEALTAEVKKMAEGKRSVEVVVEGDWCVVKERNDPEMACRETDFGYAVAVGSAETRKTVDALLDGDAETIEGDHPLMLAFDNDLVGEANAISVGVTDAKSLALMSGDRDVRAMIQSEEKLVNDLKGAAITVCVDKGGLSAQVAVMMKTEESAEAVKEELEKNVEMAKEQLGIISAVEEILETFECDEDDETVCATLVVDIDLAAEAAKAFMDMMSVMMK